MYKSVIIICFILLSTCLCIGQFSSLGKIPSEDSVLLYLQTDQEDSNKVLHLVYLAKYLNNRQRDTSLLIANQALQLAEKIEWQKGIAYSHAGIAWSYYVHGNYAKALEHNNFTLNIGETEHDQKIIGLAYSNIGQVYYSLNDLHKAIEYNTKALKIDSVLNDEWGIARNIGVIGSSYQQLKKYPEALDHYQRAYAITSRIGNINGNAVWLSNIGDVYNELHDYDKALFYYNQSAPIFKSLKNNWSYAENLRSIGEVYTQLKKFEESYTFLNNSLKLSYQIVAPENEQKCLLALSHLYEVSTQSLPDTIGDKTLTLEKMRLTSLAYLKKYMSLTDSLFSNEQQKKIMNLEVNAKIDSMHLEQTKKDLVSTQQIQKQKVLRNSFIAGSILLILLIVVIINRNKLKSSIEMERMRNRLSRDLHDDIGSTLSSINILSRTSQTNLHSNQLEKTTSALEKINERSTRLLDNMRDIIWNINPENDSIEEVMSRMREYASVLLEAKNIAYTFDFPEENTDYVVSMEIKNNLYLVFKEAVNNLSKYSKAEQATFSFRTLEHSMILTIQDNGVGFDEDNISHKGGLINMRHRINEINGKIEIQSTLSKGTLIQVIIPRHS